MVGDIPVEIWDRKEGPGGDSHVYKVAVSDRRPVQMLTTGPDLGSGREENQKDYLNYIEKELDASIFEVPAACSDAEVLPLEEFLALPDVVLDM